MKRKVKKCLETKKSFKKQLLRVFSLQSACRQFHQHFTYKFFMPKLFWQLFLHTCNYKKAVKWRSYKKCVQKMLMKLTPGCCKSWQKLSNPNKNFQETEETCTTKDSQRSTCKMKNLLNPLFHIKQNFKIQKEIFIFCFIILLLPLYQIFNQ